MKHAVTVSHEMTTLVGYGPVPDMPLPADAAVFLFEGFSAGQSPTLSYRHECDLEDAEDMELVFVVKRSACLRLFSTPASRNQSWHLPSGLRMMALSIVACDAEGETLQTLRLARSIELLCQVHAALADGTLLPSASEGWISETDIARIAAARRLIDQRWHEKLTIGQLSRAVGINRDKLVRGFRELYGATIAQILSERRLAEARSLLLASDLPVARVAYRCSYQNNASFTRAFTRRFGVPPTEMRRTGAIA